MPRRRRRFSDLERQFRDSGGVAEPGSRLAGYIEFKKGLRKIDVNVVLTAQQRARVGFGILPFNLAPSDPVVPANRYAAPITNYSNGLRTTIGLTNLDLGYADIDASTNQTNDFYPALLKVFVPTANAAPLTPISGVTGKEYTRKAGRSATVPFGRTTAGAQTDTEETRKRLLIVAAKTGTGADSKATSASYEPEIFKSGRAPLASPS